MRPTKRQIAEEVAAKYGLSLEDLRGKRHRHKWAVARQEAWAACYANRHDRRQCSAYSLPAIAAFFGGRSHTTILHGLRVHEARKAAVQ